MSKAHTARPRKLHHAGGCRYSPHGPQVDDWDLVTCAVCIKVAHSEKAVRKTGLQKDRDRRVDQVAALSLEYDRLIVGGGDISAHVTRCREMGYEALARRAERSL